MHGHKIGKRLLDSSCLSVFLPVHPSAWNDSTPTGRIFMKMDILLFFEKLSINFGLLKYDKNN